MNHIFYPNNKPSVQLSFIKYHGNGNDFIIIDSSDAEIISYATALTHRNLGIGADGIIMLRKNHDNVFMTVINADGSVAANCGNGLRCAAAHIFKTTGLTEVSIKLAHKSYRCVKDGDAILVTMGLCEVQDQGEVYLQSCAQAARIGFGALGNHHLICILPQPIADFALVCEEIKQKFPQAMDKNIGIVFKQGDGFYSKVYERGVGFTNSCGSFACAAASFLMFLNKACGPKELSMEQPGGIIVVTASLETENGYLVAQKGPAQEVFRGLCEVETNC